MAKSSHKPACVSSILLPEFVSEPLGCIFPVPCLDHTNLGVTYESILEVFLRSTCICYSGGSARGQRRKLGTRNQRRSPYSSARRDALAAATLQAFRSGSENAWWLSEREHFATHIWLQRRVTCGRQHVFGRHGGPDSFFKGRNDDHSYRANPCAIGFSVQREHQRRFRSYGR